MLLLFPLLSLTLLLSKLFQQKLTNSPSSLRSNSYHAIYFLLACIFETELLLHLNLHISFSKMSAEFHPSAAAWTKLIPENSTTSAAMQYHLHWETMALRKFHDATDIPGTLDILLVPVPEDPDEWTPAQEQLLEEANYLRPDYPDPPELAATQVEISRYNALLAYYKICSDRATKLEIAKQNLKQRMWESLDQTTRDHVIPIREDYLPLSFAR